ncbi:uncharacterized protein LOC124533670 [Vanessa cardui]|uniref:uncharacterized protein LOC124533670 n=1 Tax=Vanessa cardui TaxID=171605 RepID=UPI001F136837|nr:uncharacterized protein LOC124533670 [Vanessa cardui]
MTIIQKCLQKIEPTKTLSNIRAELAFPKVVIFEEKTIVRICDITKPGNTNDVHSFQKELTNYVLHGHNLWLLLLSGEIYVINIIKNSIIEVQCNSLANYKIQRFIILNSDLIFVSESGERLCAHSINQTLEEEFSKGTNQIVVSFEKSPVSTNTNICVSNFEKETNTYIAEGKLVVKCNASGLVDVLNINAKLQHVAQWNDMNVICDDLNMWILNQHFDLVHKFECNNDHYYPLAANDDIFYYVTWKKDEIGIYHASISEYSDSHNDELSVNQKKNFSSQETLKLQLKTLVEDAITHNTAPNQVLPQLQVLFNDIEDFSHLITTASKLCHKNLMYKAILYQLQKRICSTDDDILIDLICDVIIKTDLLEYVQFRGGSYYDDVNIFEMDFIQLCVTFISKSDLDLASICWIKYSEIKPTPSADDVTLVLNAIPLNIKMGALVIWFRNFVPPLLDQNPFYIDLFVKWTTDRVFLLEQSTYWPKIGLKFISAIVEVLETSIKTICIRPISIDDLDVIKDHINYVLELKEKYKINMLLSEFSSQSPSEIALIMLRRCYTEDLEAFLQESLPTYASRHFLEIDDTLRSFIESEAASSGGSVDGQRFKILLNAFHYPNNRLECLLNVLKLLDVPWNPIVLSIATTAAALTHTDFTITDTDRNLANEIYKELNYAKIKVILKKYNFPLTCTDYTLVIHKLINNSIVDLDDLKVITTILTNLSLYANSLYIDKCLRNSETKLALEYFKSLCNRSQKILIKTMQNKYEQIITGVTTNPQLERNYIDFLKGSLLLDEIMINRINNLYYLKNSYDIKLSINTIFSNKNRQNALKRFSDGEEITSSSGRGRCISQLMSKEIYQQSKLISLLRRISSSRSAKMLVESLILMGDPKSGNNKTNLSQYKDERNSADLIESYNILSEVVSCCDEEYLHHLLKCLSMLNALLHSSVILKNLSLAWKFQYIFLPMSSINGLNDLINFYTNVASNNFLESDVSDILTKSDFIPFRIFSNIIHNTLNSERTLCDEFNKVREKVVKKLVTKVVASQDIDQILITCLLLILKNTDVIEDKIWILELLRGQSESLPPAAMHYLSSPIIRRTFELENILPGSNLSYPPQYTLKSKFNINLSEIALPENTEETWDAKVLLFYILRHYPQTPYDRLIDLCHTLNIPKNDGFSLLLISVLVNWELKYKIYENDLGSREIITEHDVSYLTSKCFILWQSIEDKEFLKDVLNDFWKNGEVIIHGCLISINPYYYEIYLCIYQLIFSTPAESKVIREYYLLQFLKEYKRKSTPKQYEYELFSVKGMFPEIGHYRLPFHLFMRDDMWSNLKSEITLETYEAWLPVVALLSLDGDLQTARDMICSNAVKQTMTSRKRYESNDTDSKDNEPWRLTSREEPLLRTAHRCVRYIANMEWAGACLFYVLQGCTRGADQVAAAQLCYQFSQRWATIQPGNRAVRQMERLHSTLSTRHVLYKINWAREELLRLSSEPVQLIHALYLHPDFIDKITRYDINRAANEIADKNNINISSIRIQLLENILDKRQKEKDNSPGLDTKDLITAKYILKATCSKMGAIYLSRIAFDDDSDYNKCKQLRALQCLMSVVEPDTAIKVSNRERGVLWKYLLELLYIVYLEKIDMPWVVATFMQNKILALNQLLQVSGNNVDCLKIVGELAHRFGNVQIIRQAIPMLLRASLIEDMIPLLLKIQHSPDNIIYTAWRAIILSPFQRADYPITDRQKSQCLKSLNLLPVCPVIKDEDLIEIWKNCVRCKCLGLGCLLLPYMTPKTRQSLSELQKIDKRNLIISLKNLYSESYLVPGAMYVLDNLTKKTYR